MPDVPSQYLKWNYRRKRIIQELLDSGGDILCLQEVDKIKDLEKGLKGFAFEYLPRGKDGVAIFWNCLKFRLISQYKIMYDPIILDLFPEEAQTRRNALILELEHLDSGHSLLVATTHLEWKPSHDHIKVLQGTILLKELEKIQEQRKERIPVIICGDFNSLPTSLTYKLYSTGRLCESHCTNQVKLVAGIIDRIFNDVSAIYDNFVVTNSTKLPQIHQNAIKEEEIADNVILSHSFELKSVYESEENTLNFVTNFKMQFRECLDYIWYEPKTFQPVKTKKLPSIQDLKCFGSLPSAGYPSDHLMLKTTLAYQV